MKYVTQLFKNLNSSSIKVRNEKNLATRPKKSDFNFYQKKENYFYI